MASSVDYWFVVKNNRSCLPVGVLVILIVTYLLAGVCVGKSWPKAHKNGFVGNTDMSTEKRQARLYLQLLIRF